MNKCIHGRTNCDRLFCSFKAGNVIKQGMVQKLCGYHIGMLNTANLTYMLDSLNCDECKKDPPPSNVIAFRRPYVS